MHPSERPVGAPTPVETASKAVGAPHSLGGSKTRVGDPKTLVVCAIPARFGSQRLPGKALRLIAGKPMIQHVAERVASAKHVDRTVVLTDDERIARAVESFGCEAEMTPEDCTSGTDRIAWAADRWAAPTDAQGAEQPLAVVNVQGDEPMIDPALVDQVARHLVEQPQDEMVTVSTPFTPAMIDQGQAADPSNVKVVTDLKGLALYFSRSLIPYDQECAGRLTPQLHVGLYGYRRDVLARLAALEPTPLEQTESLEQLRALENGIRIRVLQTKHAAFGVDTESDLERAEAILSNHQ